MRSLKYKDSLLLSNKGPLGSILLDQVAKHWWFSGRILACHAGGPGSIPGQCNAAILFFKIYYFFYSFAILMSFFTELVYRWRRHASENIHPKKMSKRDKESE